MTVIPDSSEARVRLLSLLTARAYARRPVVLASGKSSDFYIDCKQVTLHSEGAFLAGLELFRELVTWEQAGHEHALAVGGLTLGADPLATSASVVSHLLDDPREAFIVRKEPKDHGTQRYLEGLSGLPAGSLVVVLEDVVTTGGSSMRAVERVRAEGFRVELVLALVDRQEGGREALEAEGLILHSLFLRSDFPA
ncbi:MAG: orotate phosphoribosyltransferase [Myxococcota bacterium]